MALTPAQYTAFITTVDTTVGAIYSQMDAGSTYKQWTRTIPVEGTIWNAGWTGRMPKMRPWFGSRVVQEPGAQTYQVTTYPAELTYGIDKFQLQDSDVNTTSIFWRMLPDMAFQIKRQPEYDLRDLLEGTGIQTTDGRQNGMDGLAAFNTAHPINLYIPNFNGGGNALFSSGTYCNDFTSGGQTINGTLIGGALGTTSFASLLAYMRVIPDESGEVLGVTPDALMVPPTLEIEARFITKSAFLASPTWGAFSPLTGQVGTADNQLAKMGVQVLVNSFLKQTKRWYLMDTTHGMEQPMRWLVREMPRIIPRVNEDDPVVFDTHRYLWGAYDRVAPAWGYSWLIARSGP